MHWKAMALLAALPLAACGGGGGSESETATSFVSESAATAKDGPDRSSLETVLEDELAGTLSKGFRKGALVTRATIDDDFQLRLLTTNNGFITFLNDQIIEETDTDRRFSAAEGKRVAQLSVRADGTTSGALSHTAYGVWLLSRDEQAALLDQPDIISTGNFLFGSFTPASNMPRTGNATYKGNLAALELDSLDGQGIFISGDVRFDANFSSATIDGAMNLERPDGSAYGTISMPATRIENATFSSDQIRRDNGDSGALRGFFTGSNGQELGGNFVVLGEKELHGSFGAGLCASSSCKNSAFD